MTRRRDEAVAAVLLALLILGGAGSTAAWAQPSPARLTGSDPRLDGGSTPTPSYTPRPHGGYRPGESIGIRLLDAPVNRRDDPRAQTSIVDHLAPGTTIRRRIEVSNISTKKSNRLINVYAGAATIKDHEFRVSSGRKPNELASWISVDRPLVDLPPDTTAVVYVTIRVPKSATKGERYAAIWAWTTSRPGRVNTLGLASGVGIPVFLDVGPGGEEPSDFRIDGLTAGRTEDGTPQVQARVRNTGGRALVMSGSLTLSEGPGGLEAGPYTAKRGTTLRPGENAPVLVVLDPQTPDGPWKVRLTLRSGRISHTVTGTLTFPEKRGSWGIPASLDSPLPLALTMSGGLAGVGILTLAVVAIRRNRARTQFGEA